MATGSGALPGHFASHPVQAPSSMFPCSLRELGSSSLLHLQLVHMELQELVVWKGRSSSCLGARGRLHLRCGSVPLPVEVCPGRAPLFASVCSSPPACGTSKVLLRTPRPLRAAWIDGWALLRGCWSRVTVPSCPASRLMCGTQPWLGMGPWKPACSRALLSFPFFPELVLARWWARAALDGK